MNTLASTQIGGKKANTETKMGMQIHPYPQNDTYKLVHTIGDSKVHYVLGIYVSRIW